MMILVLGVTSVTADTEIYRCMLDDGTVAFQETPCPDTAAAAADDGIIAERNNTDEASVADDDLMDFVNPYDEPASASTAVETTLPRGLSKNRKECEKRARDAIDAIDLELRETSGSKEAGREHLAELLELTRQLRACKRL